MSKNNHNSKVGSSIERSNERITATSEVFTPVELICLLLDQIPEEILMNPESKFLDNAAGCGNFFLALKDILLQYHTEEHIINNMFYAVEFMEDNHKEMCERLGVSIDHSHFVCANALEYDYSFGQPVGLENELGKIEAPELYTPPTIEKKSQAAPLFRDS